MKSLQVVFLLICLGFTTFSTLQGSVFGAVLPSIVKELNVDWGLIGVMIGLWTVVSAVSPFFLGKYLHSLKPLHSAVIVMLVLASSTISTSFVRSFLALNISRVIASFPIPFSWPLAAKMVEMYISNERRGVATAVYNNGSIIGLALAYVVVAIVGGAWQRAMIAAGLIGLVYSLLLYLVRKYFLDLKTDKNYEEQKASNNHLRSAENISSKRVYTIVFWLTLGHFSAVYTWNLMFTWLSTFLIHELRLNYGVIAISLSIIAIISSVLSVLVGLWSDRVKGIKGRVIPLYAGLLPSAVLLMIAPYTSSLFLTTILMSLSMLLWRIPTPSFWAIFGDLVPPGYFEKASSVYVGAVLISGVVSSIINGYIVSITGSMKYAILVTSIVLVFSPIFYTIAARQGYEKGLKYHYSA